MKSLAPPVAAAPTERPAQVPEYLWRACAAPCWLQERGLRAEVVRRVMAFRGKAVIQHEANLMAQKKALIASTDGALQSEGETLTQRIALNSMDQTLKTLLALFETGTDSGDRADEDMRSCFRRCQTILSERAEAYASRKRATALDSMQSEISSLAASLPQHYPPRASGPADQSPTLRQLLEAEMGAALERERSLLGVGMRLTDAEQHSVDDILELAQLNLNLAAKVAVLRAMQP